MPWARASAPLRVIDAGGWTDTWFAAHGLVCHLAVGPGPEVLATWQPGSATTSVQVAVASSGEEYTFDLGSPPGRHPLLEAVAARFAPRGGHLRVEVGAPVPPGSSLGTSAAVVVAMASALLHLDGRRLPPGELARLAHMVETSDLGLQSGVQDQVAAAFGGANRVTISPYPEFRVEALDLGPAMASGLSERLFTVYLGGHDSSAVHRAVIARLEQAPEEATRLMGALREAASEAARALGEGDLSALGAALAANTETQAALHPDLVNPTARSVIELARAHGALGWKVNGAGGHGGTVTVLAGDDPRGVRAALDNLDAVLLLPLHVSSSGAKVLEAG